MNNVYNNGIDLSVTVNGRPTRIYTHEGRYFIESREGTEYVIEISNRNWYRVEAVVAVDGLSVMNGEPSSVEDYGYVIPANGSIKVKGYRKNMEEVGAFKFSKKEQSYAADKGEASNVGVIAVAVWREKAVTYGTTTLTLGAASTADWVTPGGSYGWNGTSSATLGSPTYTTSVGSTTYSATANASSMTGGVLRSMNASFDHGTTWGSKVADKVTTTTFDRDCIIAQTEVFYNSKENLEGMGIKLVQEKLVNFPVGFPGSFAKPPSGWKS